MGHEEWGGDRRCALLAECTPHTAPETREDVRSGIPSPSSSFHPQSLLLFLHPPPTCYPEAFLLPPSILCLASSRHAPCHAVPSREAEERLFHEGIRATEQKAEALEADQRKEVGGGW